MAPAGPAAAVYARGTPDQSPNAPSIVMVRYELALVERISAAARLVTALTVLLTWTE